MKIQYHKKFTKHFSLLPTSLKKKVRDTIELFAKDPHDPQLKNHALSGTLKDKRAITVTHDIRILFEVHNNYVLVIFLDVGTHNRVYK